VAERRLRKVQLKLVTHESRPLELFGTEASEAVRALLDERGIELVTDRVPLEARDGQLLTAPGSPVDAQCVVSLPRIEGPSVAGLPHDGNGFIPVDSHARVESLDGVFAAGDATTCPLKQGGIATQQADAASEAIAAELGAELEPQPFRPVLRGLLLTGAAPRYLRAEIAGGRGDEWSVSESALWWPPGKIAGRYLAPYLATELNALETPRRGIDVEIALDAGGIQRRAVIARESNGTARILPLGPSG
jgi:sulfide:quinone oxidoreductase